MARKGYGQINYEAWVAVAGGKHAGWEALPEQVQKAWKSGARAVRTAHCSHIIAASDTDDPPEIPPDQ